MAGLTLKSIEGEGIPDFMAKRPSKALRGKRRWLGVAFAAEIQSRNEAKEVIQHTFGHLTTKQPIRLMDFHPHGSDQASASNVHLEGGEDSSSAFGYGILQVPHDSYTEVKTIAQDAESMSRNSIRSLTSSGKIRLVRERLGLTRPPRQR